MNHISDFVHESDVETDVKQSNNTSVKESNKKSLKKLAAKPFSENDRKAMMEKAEKELPYTFEVFDDYEELNSLLRKHNADYQAVILERMIKCNHPKVEPANREKMVTLFTYLLQYINDIASEVENVGKCFEILDRITPFLYDLSHINPAETTKFFLEVIKEKQSDYKKSSKQFPKLDTLVFLKLVSYLYSTSDFRHTIVSPCIIFISHILTRSHVMNRSDISAGLFLVTIILEYTQLSKRFLPAAINFLTGTMFLCVKKRSIQSLKVLPPFHGTGNFSSLLTLDNVTAFKQEQRLLSTDLVEIEIDDDFKVRAFNMTLLLANHLLTKLDENNNGLHYITDSFTIYLEKISFKNYPKEVKLNAATLKKTIHTIKDRELMYLVPEMRKPKQLRQLEPRFGRVYDDKRDKNKFVGKLAERKSLQRKIKGETKGAVREIRRDNQFLSRIELKRTMQRYLIPLHFEIEKKKKQTSMLIQFFVILGTLNERKRLKNCLLKLLFNRVNLMLWIVKRNICKLY